MSDYYLKPTSPIKRTTDEYCYNYDHSDSSISGHKDYWLKVIFIDGKFDSVKFIREDVMKWIGVKEVKLMDLINQEIKRLELTYIK